MKNKIGTLSDEEIYNISRLFRIIDLAIPARKAEKNLFIPLSYFPDDISKFDIITLLNILENDFELFSFLGFLNGEKEETASISLLDTEKFYALKKIIQKQADKIKSVKKHPVEIGKVIFDDKTASLEIDGKNIFLPADKKEHNLCRVMFKFSKNEPVDWSEVYDEITGEEYLGDDKGSWRMIYDTTRRINNRIYKKLNTNEKLFTMNERIIKRNF